AAGAVFDDDGAIEHRCDMLRDEPAKRVTARARREREDDLGQRTCFSKRVSRPRDQRQAETSSNEIATAHSSLLHSLAHYTRRRQRFKSALNDSHPDTLAPPLILGEGAVP